MPPNENGETRNPAQQPLPHRLRAHNARIWATLVLIRLAPASAQSGGYVRGCRRMVDHALRSASELEGPETTLPELKGRTRLVVRGRSSTRHERALPSTATMYT
jgi:hypothetical protein